MGLLLAGLLLWSVRDGVSSSDGLPGLTILYTTDTRGFLQTCGCSHSGLGGLDRRATLVKQARAEGTPLLLVDSGNLAEDLERAKVVLAAMAAMGYDAVGVGPLDLKVGDAFYQEAAAAGVPTCVSPPRPKGVPESVPFVRRLEVGDVRVGVVALAPLSSSPPSEEGRNDDALWTAVEPTLRDLRAGSDLVVVLSQRGLAWDRALAQRASRGGAPSQPAEGGLIDLLIGNVEARSLTQPEIFGRTWLLPTTDRGQEVGRVDVTFTESGLHFAWRRIPLDRTFGPEPRVEGIVGEYYAAQAQRLLDASLAKRGTGDEGPETGGPDLEAESLMEAAYVPAVKCGECHRPQYEQWQGTKHARAVETLAAKQRLVPECLPCHSEQYRRTEKFIPNLGERDGVQCSTCHGEGVVHSLLARKERIERETKQELCVSCHDEERDPEFAYAADLGTIRHW